MRSKVRASCSPCLKRERPLLPRLLPFLLPDPFEVVSDGLRGLLAQRLARPDVVQQRDPFGLIFRVVFRALHLVRTGVSNHWKITVYLT